MKLRSTQPTHSRFLVIAFCARGSRAKQMAPSHRGNASDFALTTLHVYSMIWSEQIGGEVDALLPKSPIFRVPTGRRFGFSRT